ncbi:MAG: hypothetical protein ACKOFO_09770, partial [Gemmatimonadota bacterium]
RPPRARRSMIARLAIAALTRRRARTALTVAGVAVAAAMLLDMVMLGSGMRESFRGFIDQQGFQLRLTPRGTMPFDSEATVGGATALVATLRADPDIVRVGPVLGGKHFVAVDTGVVAGFLLGIDPAAQGDYRLEAGRDLAAADEIVVSAASVESAVRRDSLAGATLGLGLGLVTARWLNGILATFPGLPAAFDFFRFEPGAAFRALGLLVCCGIAAGIWPAWRTATLPIATTLREEAVA